MRVFETIVHGNEQDLMQENANVDGRSPMGVMGTFASESAKYYAVENLLSNQVKRRSIKIYYIRMTWIFMRLERRLVRRFR